MKENSFVRAKVVKRLNEARFCGTGLNYRAMNLAKAYFPALLIRIVNKPGGK